MNAMLKFGKEAEARIVRDQGGFFGYARVQSENFV